MRHHSLPRYLVLSGLLFAFWILLSGYFTPLLLALGLASAMLVVAFMVRMARVDQSPVSLRPGPKMVRYLLWLMWQVVLTNIDLARRIWDPRLPIRPLWQRLDIRASTPMEKALYANSITLTPGTLTTDVKEDHFMVHALSAEAMEDLRRGEMERRILELGL